MNKATIALLLMVVVCTFPAGTGATPPPRREVLYRGTQDGYIRVYRVGKHGALSPLPQLSRKVGTYTLHLRLIAGGRFLCAVQKLDSDKNSPGVFDNPTEKEGPTMLHVFRIEKTGALTPTQTVPLPQTVGNLIEHPNGSLLWLNFFTAPSIVLPIHNNGNVGPIHPLPSVMDTRRYDYARQNTDAIAYDIPVQGEVGAA